ncbi:hypothetical protein, partial [Aeromonas veronii]|uniref:hypothetical protein n=1 Tax=Aeromonas veronii TaxID=654 RepID=UPI0038B5AA2F
YLKSITSIPARERGAGFGPEDAGPSASTPENQVEPKLSHPKLKPGAQLVSAVVLFAVLVVVLAAGDWIWNYFQALPK